MTNYQNLPVYKASYDLIMAIFSVIKEFPREYKYSIWDNIKNKMFQLVEQIYLANSSFENRKENIDFARKNLEILRLYLRICKDLQIISLTKYINIIESTENISKQLFAWQKSI